MSNNLNYQDRKPIWMALSEFYLDTQLQPATFSHIARKIIESPYTLIQVKKINKYEVFPVLQINLLDVAGVWSGFQEEWLVKKIKDTLNNQTIIRKIGIEIRWRRFKWMQKTEWEKLEEVYTELTTKPDALS